VRPPQEEEAGETHDVHRAVSERDKKVMMRKNKVSKNAANTVGD
jgi:hypothetical protein